MRVPVKIEVSARHIHLTEVDDLALFGEAKLHPLKELSQKGQFAEKEQVTVSHEGKSIPNVRVVGPFRATTLVELAPTDARELGYDHLPLKAGHTATGGVMVTLKGPKGSVSRHAAFYSKRHVHSDPKTAKRLGLKDGDEVSVEVSGRRGLTFHHVVVRIRGDYTWSLHLDTDEANAAGVDGGEHAVVIT